LRLSELVHQGNFIRIMEMFPPGIPSPEIVRGLAKYNLGIRFDRLIESIEKLESLADAFCLPELNDGRRIHLDSVGIATELKRRTGNDIVPTVTLRDANRQHLMGSISFALFAGLENMMLVRGDPYQGGNGEPKNVYDWKSVSSLVKIVRKLEDHLESENKLCIITPINLRKCEDLSYISVVREREVAGVDLFMAEQMFENPESYTMRIASIRKSGITRPIIHTVFPIKDYEDGINCVRKFGWSISQDELRNLKTRGSVYGLEMARFRYHSLLDRKDSIEGVCISTRGNPELARFITS
jgi:5,10-methylenetetrahydrofolate reductase